MAGTQGSTQNSQNHARPEQILFNWIPLRFRAHEKCPKSVEMSPCENPCTISDISFVCVIAQGLIHLHECSIYKIPKRFKLSDSKNKLFDAKMNGSPSSARLRMPKSLYHESRESSLLPLSPKIQRNLNSLLAGPKTPSPQQSHFRDSPLHKTSRTIHKHSVHPSSQITTPVKNLRANARHSSVKTSPLNTRNSRGTTPIKGNLFAVNESADVLLDAKKPENKQLCSVKETVGPAGVSPGTKRVAKSSSNNTTKTVFL